MMSCYGGPDGSAGVGACTSGTTTCIGGDAGWGPCVGAVTPTVESCSVAGDFDCDGVDNDHCAEWSFLFGAPSAINQAYGISVNAAGRAVITGTIHAGVPTTLGIDAGPFGSVNGVFTADIPDASSPSSLALVSYSGNLSTGTSVALDPDGGIVLSSDVYYGAAYEVTFGGTTVENTYKAATFELAVAHLVGASAPWVTGIAPQPVSVFANAVAVTSTSVYLAATYDGAVQLLDAVDAGGDAAVDAETLHSGVASSGLLVRFDLATAAFDWGLSIGGNTGTAYTTAAAGNTVLVGGSFDDPALAVGSTSLPGSSVGLPSGYVLRVASGGTLEYGVSFPSYTTASAGAGTVRVDSIAALSGAQAVAVGRYGGNVDFGAGQPLDGGSSPGNDAGDGGGPGCGVATTGYDADLFIAVLGTDLTCKQLYTVASANGFNGPTALFPLRPQGFGPQVAVDGAGIIHVVANFTGQLSVDTPSGPVALDGGNGSILLLAIDPIAKHVLWVRQYVADNAGAYATGIGADAVGNTFLIGQIGASGQAATVSFQVGSPLTWPSAAKSQGMFVAKIAH